MLEKFKSLELSATEGKLFSGAVRKPLGSLLCWSESLPDGCGNSTAAAAAAAAAAPPTTTIFSPPALSH